MERWLPVVGFEGLYEVSDLGRVRGAKGVLSHNRTLGGYHIVHLYYGGRRRKVRLVSRLVLEAFRGTAPSPQHQAAHKGGDKDNNALANLRWATPKSNEGDKQRHGTAFRCVGEAVGRGVLTRIAVERIRDLRRVGCTHKQISEWVGTCLSNVCYVLQGRTWSHV